MTPNRRIELALLRYMAIRLQHFYLYRVELVGRAHQKISKGLKIAVKACMQEKVRFLQIPAKI